MVELQIVVRNGSTVKGYRYRCTCRNFCLTVFQLNCQRSTIGSNNGDRAVLYGQIRGGPTGIERGAIDVCKQLCIRISVLAGWIGIPTFKGVTRFDRFVFVKCRNVCAVVNFFRRDRVTIYESHINGGNNAFVRYASSAQFRL